MGATTVMMTTGTPELPRNVIAAIAESGYTSARMEFIDSARGMFHMPKLLASACVDAAGLICKRRAGYDFTEAFASVSYRWLTLKYSHTLTDLAGFNQNTGYLGHSRGSRYIDLSADIPLADGYMLGLHAGRQHITTRLATPTAGGSSNPDFTDYRVSLNKTLPDGWNASLALAWNDNTAFYNQTPSNLNANDTRNIGKKRVVVSIGKTF